jgi:hypothetical protein
VTACPLPEMVIWHVSDSHENYLMPIGGEKKIR